MEKRKVSNLIALAVLSLLKERPMHPYEMVGVMRRRELDTVIKLNQSALYSVIEALVREGFIVPTETQREGRYPERTVYATTETGKVELSDWLRSLLREPAVEYSAFAAALAFLGNLSPTEAETLLSEHAHALSVQISRTQAILEEASQLGVDLLFLIEESYTLTLQTAKFTFVQRLIREINDGTLTEMSGEQRIWKMTHPELAFLMSHTEPAQEDPGHFPQQDH
jgi:DNA-binding PadR family transcriptional regulator